MPATYVWLLAIFLITMFSIYSMQLAARHREDDEEAGPALIEFGRAFPNEAVRDVVTTADRQTVFLRLFDNKVGCVQYRGRTMSCRLLHPGSVTVLPGESENAVRLDFKNSVSDSGQFFFTSEKQAAEVSLWLLGSFAASGGGDDSTVLSPA
ncbi:hypothetical protein SAMN05421890_4006 [Ensifer adhaerens]|nr:hypothetical protein SAMN05421890_4006 [Ensifer adhaerens]HZG28525.1 hypothetical protein [Ensifer sp.]